MSSSDRYQLLGRLAVGGMSEVFFAKQIARGGFSRMVVVKQLLPTSGDEDRRRLLDEARLSASITHENVVTVFDVGSREGKPFVAMEYVHGVAASVLLRHAIRSETLLPLRAVVRVVQDAARGLFHAHEACDDEGANLGIVHRDVAPKNILVRKDGITKIADFGIALAHERLSQTVSGAVCGTLSYMAPEQARMQHVAAQTDQFSLGAVLWELLVGQHLFKTGHRALTLQRLLGMPIDAPSQFRDDIPPALDAIVLRMLARDPALRFASMDDVVDALEDALEDDAGGSGGVSSDAARREVAALVHDAAHEELAAREIEMRSLSASLETDAETILWSSSSPMLAAPGPSDGARHNATAAAKTHRSRAQIIAVTVAATAAASCAALVVIASVVLLPSLSSRDVARDLHDQRRTAPIVMRAGFAAAAARAHIDEATADAIGFELGEIVAARLAIDMDDRGDGDASIRRARVDAALDTALATLPVELATFARTGVQELSSPPAAAIAHVSPFLADARAHAGADLAAAIASEGRRARADAKRVAHLTHELERRLQRRITLVERTARGEDTRAATAALDDDTHNLVECALPVAAAEPVFVVWQTYLAPKG